MRPATCEGRTELLALFDIDGTLLTAGGAGSRTLSEVFHRQFGVAEVMREVRCAGKTDPLIINEIFGVGLGRQPTIREADALIAAYEALLPATLAESPGFQVLPGVPEALDLVEGLGAVLGIATGNTEAGARAKLQRGGLERRFAVGGYGSDHAERDKLIARAIERGARHLGRVLEDGEIVVIGDTPRDIAAAHACGVACIAVGTGPYPVSELASAGADVAIGSLFQLADALEHVGFAGDQRTA